MTTAAATEPAFPEVKNMVAVGTVTPTSVRLWAHLEHPSRLRLLLRTDDQQTCSPSFDVVLSPESTCAFTYPNDFPDASPLLPKRRYTFELQDEAGRLIGNGKFTTPAEHPQDAPERWALAFVSCNQPFGENGHITEEAERMLTAVRKAVGAFEPEVILFLGDQIYSDAPKSMSLFVKHGDQASVLDQPADEVRRRFGQRYRQAWHAPAWQALHACAATACVPDDHDIIDNWGSDVRHNEPAWQKVRDVALAVARSWQGDRSDLPPHPSSYQQGFRWQNAGIMVLDVRTQRRMAYKPSDSQIVDPSQIELLEAFLRRNVDLDVVFVAISVPVIHVPEWLSAIGQLAPVAGTDLDDRWSNPLWVKTRDQLLTILNQHRKLHPHQQIVMLSGDIHAGWALSLDEEKTHSGPSSQQQAAQTCKPLLQFVSSAITNGEGSVVGALSNALLRGSKAMSGQVAGLHLHDVPGVAGATSNPFGGLNAGVVEVSRGQGKTSVRLRLISHGDGLEATEPLVVFDSGPL